MTTEEESAGPSVEHGGPKRSVKTNWLLRAATGVGTAAILAVVPAVAVTSQPVQRSAPVSSVNVSLAGASAATVCPGPLRVTTSATANTPGAAVGTPAVTIAAGGAGPASSTVEPLKLEPLAAGSAVSVPSLPGSGSDQGVGSGSGSGDGTASGKSIVANAGRLSAALMVTPQASTALAGVQVQSASTNSITGLAAASCEAATFESWLVGGSTDLGRTTYLRLLNPSNKDATVTVTVFTANTNSQASASETVVSARSERTVPVSSLIAPSRVLGIHVESTSAPVAAYLQQSIVRGVTPGGVDLVQSTAEPATTQSIVGLSVSGSSAQAVAAADSSLLDAAPAVRVLAPAGDATVTVTLHSAGTAPIVRTATITGGHVGEIGLGDLADGLYSVSVRSTAPVSVAARVVRGASAHPEFAWVAATNPVADGSIVTTAQDAQSSPVVVAGGTAGSVTLTNTTTGQSTNLEVPADGVATASLDAPAVYAISGIQGDVRLTMLWADGESIAAAPVPGAVDSANRAVILP